MRTMRKSKLMKPDDRYNNYEFKISGIKDFSVIERLEKLEFLHPHKNVLFSESSYDKAIV